MTGERRSIVNKLDAILATLGVKGYKALRRDRREQLNCARQDAVLKKDAPADEAEGMIRSLSLARKLLVALWRYVKDGVIPEGAKMKAA